MIKGYMLFTSDTPMIGLDPHPAYSPQEAPEAFGADTWARLYGVVQDRAELEREALEDLEAFRSAVEAGDLTDWPEDPDMAFPVTVSDSGTLTVMDPEGNHVMAEYSPADVYGAFGMDCPNILPDQRAEAWGLIREQLDGYAGLLRVNGLDRVETEYLLEDGITGLQDINLFGDDDIPVDLLQDPGQGDYPLPPLVSRSDYGRTHLVPLDGVGTLRDVGDAVFNSLSEFILGDPDATIDKIQISLDAEGALSVRTVSFTTCTWCPPVFREMRTPEPGEGPSFP